MSPVVAMWVASIVGAILFFVAGFMSAAREVAETGAGDTDDASNGTAKLADVEKRAERLTNEREALKTLVTELEGKLNARGPDGAGDVKAKLSDMKSEHERRIDQLKSEHQSQLDRLKNDHQGLLSAQQAATKQRLDELQATHQRQLDAASEPAPAVEDPFEERTRVAQKVRPRPTGEFEEQMTRVRSLNNSDGLDELFPGREHNPDSISSLLLALEMQVAEDPTWEAATLADDLGMPVVGAGEHREALAIFSSFIKELEKRSHALLPLNTLRRLTVEDTDGLVVSSCTMQELGLSLVTLTKQAMPSTPAMTGLLESTTRML